MSRARGRLARARALAGLARRRLGDPPRPGPRVFGVGTAKTGTTSLSTLFADRVRADHEPDATRLIMMHLRRVETGRNPAIRPYLRARDWLRHLKIDASQVNIDYLEDLEALFPGSRYVMTVRPPVEWLRSMVDFRLFFRRESPEWDLYGRHRFGPVTGLPRAEAPLEARGLHAIAGYLGHWRRAIERVEATIPPERLLVVETRDIGRRADEIAAFCAIPGGPVAPERARANVNAARYGVLEQVPAEHLGETVERVCGDLAARLFPDRPIAAAVARLHGAGA